MKKRLCQTLLVMLLLLAGSFGALIFPPFYLAVAGYAALIGFFFVLFGQERSKKELFWLSYGFGFAFYVVGFSWINNALLVDSKSLGAFVPAAVVAIGLFFGLFWALPALLCGYVRNLVARMLVFAVAYVFMEWVRSFIFTGFPWNLLGTAFSFAPQMIQGAAFIGTYGLSLLLLLMLLGVALLGIGIRRQEFYRSALVFVLVPAGILATSYMRYFPIYDLEGIKVRLVQPSIPQTFKWHPALLHSNFRQYIDLTKSQVFDGVDLVVWGEAATPYLLDRDVAHLEELREAIPAGGFLATGLLRLGMTVGRQTAYNSLFVIDDKGEIRDYYDKAHLVPFGEYLPFREYLPSFMRPVADIVGDLEKGEKYKNIRVKGLPLMGGAICYESIFPSEVLNKKEKPEILLVVANDGWYGVSAGPYQHLAANQMRAVEEGVTVVRSANTGISAVILPNGDIVGDIGLDVVGVSDVVLPKRLSYPTLYGRFGNVIPLGLLAVLLILALWIEKQRKS